MFATYKGLAKDTFVAGTSRHTTGMELGRERATFRVVGEIESSAELIQRHRLISCIQAKYLPVKPQLTKC